MPPLTGPDYTDEYINPDLAQALKDEEELKNKHKAKLGSIEDQIICALISTSMNIEQISNLTIRKFTKILQRIDFKMHYEIYLQASMSGFTTFKKEPDHWMSEIVRDKFAGTTEYDKLESKIKSSNCN